MPEPYRALAERDPVLGALVSRHGMPDPFSRPEARAAGGDGPLAALLLHISGQQISTVAALAIFRRLMGLLGDAPTPEALLALTPAQLRAAGLSTAKAAGVADVAARLADGRLSLERLAGEGDEEALAELTAVRGVGPWTAQMYLLHQLHRPDVLPAGDVGLRQAAGEAYGLPGTPSPRELEAMAERWRPWRSYAAALLWAHRRARAREP